MSPRLALLSLSLVLTVHHTHGLSNYMDCPGNTGGLNVWLGLRRCCTSNKLPKGCECFDISVGVDFTNTFMHLPKCPKDLGASFKVYNPANPTTGSSIQAGEASISSSGFDPSLPTMVVTHGFTDNANSGWMGTMRDEFLKLKPCNVILVDWKDAAKAINYFQATANTRMVGAMLGRLIMDINAFTGAAYSSFHLIGHSLGAHIMGYAGKEVSRVSGVKVGRISGLDPAGPQFEGYEIDVTVDKTDATFVDIIHTDAEPLLQAGFGIRMELGDVDFFPNGGQHQPGCPEETYGLLSMINFQDEKDGGACSHGRAVDLWTNSINNCRYDPPSGDSACTMGYHVSTECSGRHDPVTTGTDPFC